MHRSLRLAFSFAALALLCGCTQIPYGWKQERELLSVWGASASRSLRLTDENDFSPNPIAYGWASELHHCPSLVREVARGTRSDLYRLTTP